jgi:hypothetical protein
MSVLAWRTYSLECGVGDPRARRPLDRSAAAANFVSGNFDSRFAKILDFRLGDPIRVTSVQLSGSLAGELSFRLSSISCSDGMASGMSCSRLGLRRAIANFRVGWPMERGITLSIEPQLRSDDPDSELAI